MEGSSLTLPKLPLRRCLQDISNSSEPNLPSAAVVDFPLDKKGKKQRVYQLRPRKPSTVWTTEDDETLQAAVEKFKGGNWKKIAASLPNRSDDQCLHRWQKVLRPTLVKGYWNKEEDDELLELVHKFGTKSWAAIARSLPGRTGKQCRESCVSKMVLIYMFPYLIFSAKYTIDGNFEVHVWCNHLHPQTKKEPWSEDEDLMLFLGHQKFGNRWAEITKLLPGRSSNGIKNRWNKTMTKRADAMEDYSEKWINRNTFGDMLSLTDDVNPKELEASQDLLALNGQANIDLQASNAAEDLLALNGQANIDLQDSNAAEDLLALNGQANIDLQDSNAAEHLLALNGQVNIYLQDSNAAEDLLALNSDFGLAVGSR
ncbi:hypothetical protein AXG93_2381s1000 [Marchantia polymorpha subsp. ruderalis]|uniref:Uncharacterized protein n=1 Tax=Marchantia polymorpha subsp. ruderalis TaxID=1480154 RepID=A0A176VNB4_MARPO|nr:hypothetical protein AXG93_2381s1000 [Marchantia polymorpha subsp. ruderalis]